MTPREAATAKRLLVQYGEPVTVTKPGIAAFDPITGDPILGTAGTDYPASGYPSKYKSADVDGTNIQQNDIRLVLHVIDQRPERGWVVSVDQTVYRIMDVQAIRKSANDVLYICQLRAS
jgi:hypothetical protein